MLATDHTLNLLRSAALEASGTDDLKGFCGAMSLIVQSVFGGTLREGKVQGEKHYWNCLPDGREIDLTSSQFGGDGLNPLVEGIEVPKPDLIDPRHLVFAFLVKEKLASF